MGFNTTIMVLNDALHCIEDDPEFGKKVSDAVHSLMRGEQVPISSGGHYAAATAVETHHADQVRVIAVGGNMAEELGYAGGYRLMASEDGQVEMLKRLAEKHGYNLRKKPKKKTEEA
jgi:hypothetical protein